MGIQHLSLYCYRGYRDLQLSVYGSSVLLIGPNGAGKTNVLEAISFLNPGRGLRRARLSEVLMQESGSLNWRVSARIGGGDRPPVEVSTTAHVSEGRERRTCAVYGKQEKNLSVLSHNLSLTWITPQMDRLFLEGSSVRRRFIDRLCVALFSSYNDHMNAYEHAVGEWSHARAQTSQDAQWLAAIEQQIAEHGAWITQQREALCLALNQKIMERQTTFPRATLSFTGDVEQALSSKTPDEFQAFYSLQLARARSWGTEQVSTPPLGPHRTQVDVRHVAKNLPAALCSTGEQKALLLTIILAFAELMKERSSGVPVVLLDEAVAHLDSSRRLDLFDELKSLNLQVWMTGTDAALFEGFEQQAHVYYVDHAVITDHPTIEKGFLLK